MSAPATQAQSDVVRTIVDRIVAVAHPSRVILFGSAARGDTDADSDYDFLVIVRGPAHERKVAQGIYRNLRGILAPVDVVVVTEEAVAKYGHRVGTIIRPALREGVCVYAA